MSTLIRSAKEVARHLMHSIGLRRRLDHLHGDRRKNFEAIYETGVWQRGDEAVPGSGEGSTIDATASLRQALPEIAAEVGAKTFLDIGCGDFTWMQHVDLPCDYIGADIVGSVIERNRSQFARPDRSFIVADMVVDKPGVTADLIICREVLFHLSLNDARGLLRNALSTGASHFLLTSDSGTAFNADIESGDFRLLNLQKRPFGLPEPSRRIDDSAISSGRFIGLWTAQDIAAALAGMTAAV